MSRALVIAMSRYLLERYGQDERVTRLVNGTDLWMMPSLNPDGFERAKEGQCDVRALATSMTFICVPLQSIGGGEGRSNANHADLNRNFPDQFHDGKDRESLLRNRQPETLAAMAWIVNNPFVLSGNLHGGSVVASYPYDDSKDGGLLRSHYSAAPDDKVFRELATIYASNHEVMKLGQNCGDTFKGGITNGAAWYDVPGGMEDFNYLHSNCFEITMELSCCKFPKESTLPQEWDWNKESMLQYMEAAHLGIRGQVVDDSGGQPIGQAIVEVEDIAHNLTTTE